MLKFFPTKSEMTYTLDTKKSLTGLFYHLNYYKKIQKAIFKVNM